MNNAITYIYKPKSKKVSIFIFGGVIFLVGSICFLFQIGRLDLTNQIIEALIYIGVALLSLFGILWGIRLITVKSGSSLKLNEIGITYVSPFYSVTCGWSHISGFEYSREYFFLICDPEARVDINRVNYLLGFKKHQYTKIPLHIFVSSHRWPDDWKKEPILIQIVEKVPRIAQEIEAETGVSLG